MRGLVEERDTSIMADSHSTSSDAQAKALPDSPPPPNMPPSDIPIAPATTAAESLPGNCGGSTCDSTACSDTNSNASSTQNLSVTPNGHTYDVLQNGHLSPSEDSGIGISDQSSQSSQSPNQSFVPTQNTCIGLASGLKVVGQGGSPNALHNPPVNQHDPSSPGSYSPSTSRGVSPHEHGSPMPPGTAQQPSQSQHIVLVHVNPGETFSVRVGDQIQHIQGPATVRMVSNNGPPLPMPMQVPPGHMVQQIVDENGVLTHVILSPQPSGMPGPPGMQNAPITGGPNGGPAPMYPQFGGQYPPYCAPYPPHHHGPTPPHMVAPSPMHNSPSQHCSHPHVYNTGGAPPAHHGHSSAESTRKDKVARRLRQRLHETKPDNSHYSGASPRRSKHRVNGDSRRLQQTNGHSSSSSLDGNDMEEEDRLLIRDQLSKISLPTVSEVSPRCALIRVTRVDLSTLELVNTTLTGDVTHELLLLDKSRETKYNSVYIGIATEIKLRDLKPATEYHLKVCSRYVDVHESIEVAGSEPTDCVSFKTLACEPDTPSPPKQSQKSKTSITLKWNQTNDNGSKLSGYSLESDQGLSAGDASHFTEVYNGPQRQYKLTKLQPSTRYTFRLAAINSIGKSEFSEAAPFYTSGSAPSQPDPPMLSQAHVKALTISWVRRPTDDEFSLQMEDQETGHGFLTVFNGPDLVYKIKNLRRNTEYKFRLQASNEEGGSKWSDTQCFKTSADKPQAPARPQLKGRAHSTSFKLIWDPPKDGGGCDITKYQLELDAGRGFELRYDGSETEFICDHLQPGHSHRARVRCFNAAQHSEYSERLVVETLAVPPGACQAPKLQGKPKANTLHLKWSYPDYDGGAQVTSYEVLMTLPDNTTLEVYSGRELDCTVASLLPGRYYLFQVRALNKAGAGTWSDILEVVSGAGVPDAPKTPCVACKSSQNASVEWEVPLNNGATIQEYRLEWQPQQQQDFSLVYSGVLLSHEVRGLQPATEYNFRVQAVNSAGAGAYSPITQCSTPPSNPGAVVSLRASATADSIHLTWKEPPCHGSEIASYNIDVGEQHLISTGNVLEYVIENLIPETNYKVKVQAVNGIGCGPFTSQLRVSTHSLPPAPPTLECVQVAPNSVKLKWGDGRNLEQVQYCLEILKNNSFYPVYQGPQHVHKINRLLEITEYHFRINARNKAGEGAYADVFTCRTSKAPPPAVKEPHVSEISRDSCTVTWLPVKSMGKDTIEYTLQLQPLHGNDTDYKQIYRGEATSFKLNKVLSENSEYQVRVCAHRLSSVATQQDLSGAFSPGISVKTKHAEPLATVSTISVMPVRTQQKREWTDREIAYMILGLFSMLAVILAFVAHWIVGNADSPPTDTPSVGTLENYSSSSPDA